MRQGSKNVLGFVGHGELLFPGTGVQRAHVVQAVGQLHEDHADVLAHGQQHLADALCLALLAALVLHLAHLGQAIHNQRNLGAKELPYLLDDRVGVLHDVVQQTRGDRRGVHLHIQQNGGHLARVGEVGLAAFADLACMGLLSVLVHPQQQSIVQPRVFVALEPFQQPVQRQSP